MQNEKQFLKQFSEKLMKLISQKGWTLSILSEKSGIDEKRIDQFKLRLAVPGIGDVILLSDTLGVPSGYFFEQDTKPMQVEVVRAADRFASQQRTEASSTLNYSYEALSYHMSEKSMMPFFIHIPPHQNKVVEPSSHSGEEFLYVLSGVIEVCVSAETYTLSKGDAIYFDAGQPHTVVASGLEGARLVACLANKGSSMVMENPIYRAM